MKSTFVFALLCCSIPLVGHAQTEVFAHSTFNGTTALQLQGSATFRNGRTALTGDLTNKAGGLIFPTKRFLEAGFDTTFRFQLGAGAEGIAFLVQDTVLPGLGRPGSGLGYDGLPRSLAVEFDAQSDGAGIPDANGPHVAIQSRGTVANSSGASGRLGSAAAPSLTDLAVHTGRIQYEPGTMRVYLDDLTNPVLTTSLVLTNIGGLENGQAWFGIVAANGATATSHDMLSWSLSLAATPFTVSLLSPLDGGSFQTPATVELTAAVDYPAAIQVEFYAGTDRLFVTTNGLHYTWDGMLPGAYTITAVAKDALGRKVTSAPARLLVYPSDAMIGISFVSAPSGSTYALAPQEKAGVIPQYYWNNAPMLGDGNGSLINLRNSAGQITPLDVTYDFVTRGEETNINPNLSPDYKLMKTYGSATPGTVSNGTIRLTPMPYPIYDVIMYFDGANGGADRVAQFRTTGNNVFARDAAWSSFAGLYARAQGTADQGANTPAGNYVRMNGLTAATLILTNTSRFASDGSPLGPVNAIQIIPSIYDKNAPVFITRGPFLQSGTPTSLIFRWRSNRPATSRVQVGTDPGNLNLTVDDSVSTQEHTVLVTNLLANSQYYYAIGTTETNLARGTNYFFWTSPTTAKPTRIWATGDQGTANANQVAVRDAFLAYNGSRYLDLWLMLGDNAYNAGTDTEYQNAVFNMYTNTLPQTVAWPTLGNHETDQSHSQVPTTPYLSIFTLPQNGEAGGIPSGTERYYAFDYGNIHFVCLDSMTNDRSSNGPMANWLKTDLQANTKDWTIVFFHHPPYTKGSHDSDSPNGADFELVEMRENINPIMESYGVDLVLSGHSHCYERSYLLKGHYGYSTNLQPSMILDHGSGNPEDEDGTPYVKSTDGTVYIVGGSAGQATFGTMDHPAHYASILQLGSVIIDINGNTLVEHFLRDTGEIQDSFTMVKQVSPSGSQLIITAVHAQGGTVSLSWNSVAGTKYVVERSVDLQSGRWETVSDALTATANRHSWSSSESQPNAAFYRIVTTQ